MDRRFHRIVLSIVACALCVRVAFALAYPLATDDGRLYARIARNWIEHGAYSSETRAPYAPNYFRLPGYPSLLAAAYALFGSNGDHAVRTLQAVADTITCVLCALLAWIGCGPRASLADKRRVFVVALALAAVCPFTIIYVGALLTETVAALVWTAAFVFAAHAFATRGTRWFAAAGLAAGAGTLLRPDGVLVPAALLVALVWHALADLGSAAAARRHALHALLLALGVCAALAPWTIRNALAFGKFMPLAPKYPNLRGEFVEVGYRAWLRTWVDDFRYVDPLEWQLNSKRIRLEVIPERAFDSAAEKRHVAMLLSRYAHRGPEGALHVEMTPQIDAAFADLAGERVARHPLHCTIGVGLRRAFALWFDTHSDFYPFAGPLLPWTQVPASHGPARAAFMLLVWLYTGFAALAVTRMWRVPETRRWLLPLLAFVALRIVLLSTLENPEPRYTMEFFPLLASMIALGCARTSLHCHASGAQACATDASVFEHAPARARDRVTA